MTIMKRNNVEWNLKWIFKKSYTFVGKKNQLKSSFTCSMIILTINQTLLKPFYHGSWQMMSESGLWKRVSLVSLMETNTCGEHQTPDQPLNPEPFHIPSCLFLRNIAQFIADWTVYVDSDTCFLFLTSKSMFSFRKTHLHVLGDQTHNSLFQ